MDFDKVIFMWNGKLEISGYKAKTSSFSRDCSICLKIVICFITTFTAPVVQHFTIVFVEFSPNVGLLQCMSIW